MRALFPKLVKSYLDSGTDLFVLLGDIGVYSFKDISMNYPKNIENFTGIRRDYHGPSRLIIAVVDLWLLGMLRVGVIFWFQRFIIHQIQIQNNH